MKWLEMTTI